MTLTKEWVEQYLGWLRDGVERDETDRNIRELCRSWLANESKKQALRALAAEWRKEWLLNGARHADELEAILSTAASDASKVTP